MTVTSDAPGRVRMVFADPAGSAVWRAPLVTPLAVAGAALLGALVVRVVDPNVAGHYPVCLSLTLTGTYCPFCGGLRAVHDLMLGNVAGAFGMNPLVVLGLPFLLLAWWRWMRRAARGARVIARTPTWPAWATFGVIAAFWVARNIPALQGWLAP